jgi:hypothetical protein
LLLAALFTLGVLQQSVASPALSQCAVDQIDAHNDGCCGDTSPELACSVACHGQACITPLLRQPSSEACTAAPARTAVRRVHSNARAPDTAPPKPASA